MSKLIALKCKECGREFDVGALHVCEFCFGPLEAAYDYDVIKSRVSRQKIEHGPPVSGAMLTSCPSSEVSTPTSRSDSRLCSERPDWARSLDSTAFI